MLLDNDFDGKYKMAASNHFELKSKTLHMKYLETTDCYIVIIGKYNWGHCQEMYVTSLISCHGGSSRVSW
jgi:hypothetical protein